MSQIINYLASIALILFISACDLGNSKMVTNPATAEPTGSTIIAEQKGRLAWQKPTIVIEKLGDLKGKTIADIGAGTGYFTFRFARYADKVIAIDIDPEMLQLIEVFRENLDSIAQQRVETRLSTETDSKLWPEEVDVAVIINTIGYIDHRPAYLEELRRKIKPGGTLMIVDFKLKRLPADIAPPPESRVNIIELEEILSSNGYSNVETDDTSLDYQYIIIATRD